jgi:hypothetical protein
MKKEMFKIIAITIIPMIILLVIRSIVKINMVWLVVLGAGFFVLYISLIILTKSFDKNDWYVIKAMINKLGNEKDKLKGFLNKKRQVI